LRSAANVAAEHAPTVGKWTVTLTNGATLFKPGEGIIQVTNLSGVQYRMAILSVNYNFGNTVETTLECGEPDIQELQERHRNKALTKLVNKNPHTLTLSGSGNPITKVLRPLPRKMALTSALPGVSNVPAAADHQHAYNTEPLDALLEKDGTQHPLVQRTFEAADVTALEALADPVEATYKRGLAFKHGDAAMMVSTGFGATQRLERRIKIPALYNAGVATYGWHESVMVFTVTGEQSDYLECTDIHGDVVNVAKPHELQRTPFHGNSVAYLAGRRQYRLLTPPLQCGKQPMMTALRR